MVDSGKGFLPSMLLHFKKLVRSQMAELDNIIPQTPNEIIDSGDNHH